MAHRLIKRTTTTTTVVVTEFFSRTLSPSDTALTTSQLEIPSRLPSPPPSPSTCGRALSPEWHPGVDRRSVLWRNTAEPRPHEKVTGYYLVINGIECGIFFTELVLIAIWIMLRLRLTTIPGMLPLNLRLGLSRNTLHSILRMMPI